MGESDCGKLNEILSSALMSEHPVSAIEQLRASRWFAEHLPEVDAMVGAAQNSYHFGTVWEHTMAVLEKIAARDLVLRLAALMHDIGKKGVCSIDKNGVAHFYDHERMGAKMTKTILKQLGFSVDIVEETSFLVRRHMMMKGWGDDCANMKDKALRRVQYLCYDRERFEKLLLLVDADNRSHAEKYCMRQQISLVRIASQRLEKEGSDMFGFIMPLTTEEILSRGIAECDVKRCKEYLLKLAFVDPHRDKMQWIKMLNGFKP